MAERERGSTPQAEQSGTQEKGEAEKGKGTDGLGA